MRLLSMLATLRHAASEARNPAAYAVVSAARDFRLGTASRKRTTSSAPSTTGNFCGSRAYGIRSGRSDCLSVTPYRKRKRADRLVQRRPRYPASNQMNLKGPDVLQTKLVRRAAEEAAELGNRMHIRSLGRRRQIADCHILDHAPTQRAHLGHRGLPFQGWGEAPKPWQTERLEHSATAHRFPPQRVSLDFSNERGASGPRIERKVLCENSFFRIQDGPDADRA